MDGRIQLPLNYFSGKSCFHTCDNGEANRVSCVFGKRGKLTYFGKIHLSTDMSQPGVSNAPVSGDLDVLTCHVFRFFLVNSMLKQEEKEESNVDRALGKRKNSHRGGRMDG